MKQIKNLVIKSFSVLLVAFSLFTLIACTGGDKNPSISVSAEKTTVQLGDQVKLNVSVKNTDSATYEFSVSNPSILSVNNNTVSVLKSVDEDTKVTVTVSLVSDSSVSDSIEFTVTATKVGTVNLEVSVSNDTLRHGDSAELSVSITGTEDTTYTVTSSWDKGLTINGNTITVTGKVVLDKVVNVTVTSNANKTVSKTVTLTIKAGTEGGQVGSLTSKMIEEIGNESITVTGSITDIYRDFNQSSNNSEHTYNLKVQMEKDAWVGTWYSTENDDNVISDNYRKGSVDGLKNQYGETGHGLEKLYIDKNNKVASSVVKDYLSMPTLWESQHLWNHLGQLNINKITFNETEQAYEYTINENDEDDLWLMTYLSYSLTPMLEDTLFKLYLIVEDGHITRIKAQTEILYYGADTAEDADAMSYTTMDITISNIGTTKVPTPTPYETQTTDAYQRLDKALQEMVGLKNYTIKVTDVQEYAPSGDDTDYQSLAVSTKPVASKANPISNAFKNYLSSTGTVGCLGLVTESAIVLAKTGKYSYAMDDKLYHTEYSGYKQNSTNVYDYFEYDTTEGVLVGKRRYEGNIFDLMPQFDLSSAIFKYNGSVTDSKGVTTDTFVLRDSSITREVALELCMEYYAADGEASTSHTLQVMVNSEGHITSVLVPYSITYGTYTGYYQIEYSSFGTTELPDDAFTGYKPREIKNSWSEYMTKYYTETGSSLDSHEEKTDVVLEAIYGKETAAYFPLPEVFVRVFGDAISGPFYDYDEIGEDANGDPIYRKSLAINIAGGEVDENYQITNYDELIAKLTEALLSEGFKVSQANTDTSGGESGRATRYVCYIKDDIQIVVENIYTKYFYFNFYKTGEWTLKRSE